MSCRGPVHDQVAPQVARDVYEYLKESGMDVSEAAHALHLAVENIKKNMQGDDDAAFISWADEARLVARYGLDSITRTQALTQDMLNHYLDLYNTTTADWKDVARISAFLNLMRLTSQTTEAYLRSEGVGDQNTDKIHALEGLVSELATGASSVAGGNFQIYQLFVQRSGARVHFNTEVKSLTKLSKQWLLTTSHGTPHLFDSVILAVRFHLSNITTPHTLHTPIPPQPYIHLHVKLLTTSSSMPKSSYFHLRYKRSCGMNEPATSIVVHPPEGPDINFSIKTALQLLRDDNGYRATFIKNEVDEYKHARESVNAAVIVAAFIAGIQSQIIGYTLDKNDTKIQMVTNVFGFVGLVLDILGASSGVIHAVILKKSISEAQVPDTLFSDNERLPLSDTAAANQELVEQLHKEIHERKKFWRHRRMLPFVPRDPEFQNHLVLLFPTDGRWRWIRYVLSIAGILTRGQSTIGAIQYGVIFLLISVLCFAGYSQPRTVWITCLVVTLVIGVSLLEDIVISGGINVHEGPVLRILEWFSDIGVE
ncbi:hypothetical protein M422DRAFT_264331 [Sphaerobolus stellatus SS14]|uniref:Prenylcysteine lyase domain-containing protein n=1 Tax=Sphaerobolus stellatus (strain SS14) TaxID=990650 RepID=A0A0C9TTN1_SPHS4|nr:hypothetical protein M422DRAFT_264331 [Sphaerobolus stellatus SS14]